MSYTRGRRNGTGSPAPGAVPGVPSLVEGGARRRRYTHRTVKSTVEVLEDNKVKVNVEVDEAEFEREVDAAFKRIAKEVRLPGFRPGKAPRKLL